MLTVVATVVVVGVAAVCDHRTGRIPNWLTLPVILLAPLLYCAAYGVPGLLESMFGLIGCALVPYALFRLDAVGGGDVKLFGAIGAMTGFQLGFEILVASFVVATVYALGLLAARGQLVSALKTSLRLAVNSIVPKRLRRAVEPEEMTQLRMGSSIALAAIVVMVLQ